MRYALIGTNNDGGRNATLHNSLDEVKQAVRDYLTDPKNDPPITDEERQNMESDLSYLTGHYVESVRGSFAWKEWLYIAPVDEA